MFHTGRSFFGGSTTGSSSGGAINPISIGPVKGTLAGQNIPFSFLQDAAVSPSITLFGGFPKADLEIFLQALTENQYIRILAEPNLMALSGEEANFLAGGSYPIPVVQGSAGGGGSSISVEYHDYGVRLRFRPTVLGEGNIRLFVAPEVSELTSVGAVEIQGFTIPAISSRRAETTLELKSGQTFAMAGLLKHTVNATSSRVPVLGELPIIGPLFRSVSYQKGETELVILVTPTLVEPMSDVNLPPLPGALHVTPDDWELYGMGQIQGAAAPRLSPADAAWLKKMGFASLKGPGGWDSYDRGVAKSQATARPAAESVAEPSAAKPGEAPPSPQAPKPSNK
jgi:Flp pilus assembly secretin CpaC